MKLEYIVALMESDNYKIQGEISKPNQKKLPHSYKSLKLQKQIYYIFLYFSIAFTILYTFHYGRLKTILYFCCYFYNI